MYVIWLPSSWARMLEEWWNSYHRLVFCLLCSPYPVYCHHLHIHVIPCHAAYWGAGIITGDMTGCISVGQEEGKKPRWMYTTMCPIVLESSVKNDEGVCGSPAGDHSWPTIPRGLKDVAHTCGQRSWWWRRESLVRDKPLVWSLKSVPKIVLSYPGTV